MNQELRSEIDCRLCLESGGPCIDASLACDDGIVFAEKVSTLLHIEMSDTSNECEIVCQKCFLNVCNFFSYYQQVQRNNEYFLAVQRSPQDGEHDAEQEYDVEDDLSKYSDSIYQDVNKSEEIIFDSFDKPPLESNQRSEETIEPRSLTISPHFSSDTESSNVSRRRNEQKIELPEHLRKRVSKAKGDAKIKEFIEMKCAICGPKQPSFDTFKDMQLHYNKEHNTRGYIVCCGKKIYRKDRAMDHITIHTNPNAFKCPACGHNSKSRVLLRIHMKQHLPAEEWPFECEKCQQRFVLKSQLTNHEATHLNDDEKKFICDECGKVFALKFVLIKHKLTHSKEKKFFCEICAKSFSNQGSLTSHMRQHSNDAEPSARVQCNACGQWYKNIQTLRTHENRHRDTRDHTCEICSRKCSSKSSLSAHVRYVHMKTSQYGCNMCAKQFRRKPELTEHMARHTGEVLYRCTYCPKTFSSSSNFFAHRKSRHPVEYKALQKTMSNKSDLESLQ